MKTAPSYFSSLCREAHTRYLRFKLKCLEQEANELIATLDALPVILDRTLDTIDELREQVRISRAA